jgi:hypothetical protein
LDLYSGNPFRVLGLRSDASSKEIARASGRLLKWLEIEEKPQVEEPLPFLRMIRRDVENIKRAVGQIENPRDRIQQELFWPGAKNSYFQSCCERLTQGRYGEFIGLCEYAIAKADSHDGTGQPDNSSEKIDASLCRHFQAIFYHSAAISASGVASRKSVLVSRYPGVERNGGGKLKSKAIPSSTWSSLHWGVG